MRILLLIFIGILLLRFFLNLIKWSRLKHYYKRYQQYLDKPEHAFLAHIPKIQELISASGVKDKSVPHVKPAGFGYIATATVSVLDNLSYVDSKDLILGAAEMFSQAIGIYRNRALECFNPLFWIEFIIFLPKHILSYLNIAPDKAIVKIFQLVFWATSALTAFLYGVFKAEIDEFIKAWILRLTP